MTGRPTIVDVAERAGVSKSLVSLVMRNSPSVSDEKRERVLKAASELEYRPNAMARSLVRQRTYVIGVVISDFSNPFFAEVAGGIEEAALAADYRALFNSGDRDAGERGAGAGDASSASNRRRGPHRAGHRGTGGAEGRQGDPGGGGHPRQPVALL